jgi:hypothetical protein
MLTKLTIKNFKRFDEAEVDLGKSVVLIGPNNSGKTTALQALALWELGLRRWTEKRQGKSTALQRQGVAINRRDLVALPVPVANLLWRDLHVRNAERQEGKPKTQNVRVDIMVEGITDDQAWSCGLEFDYATKSRFIAAHSDLTRISSLHGWASRSTRPKPRWRYCLPCPG